jgi:nucleoside-diphosphate-sugar epimerase/glyoxylase-like metal-dependent hydrolase (beta-lactamase superfamily II)
MRTDELPQPVLITGATGFLGGRLAEVLLAEGVPVRVTGRNLRRGQALARLGADFRPVDLRDRPAVLAACRGMAAVVHAGALSSAWGSRRDFFEINVEGTQNVVDGCLAAEVGRLVHISSPSVMTRPVPQLGLRESDPLPDTFVSLYSETKKLAEDRVNAAMARGLRAVILRPKAIYGPGDNAIFPRLIEAARRGRLPRIGDGETVTDITHVDDVVRAIRLALVCPEALGKTYCITGNRGVRIWDLIGDLLARLGYAPPSKQLSLAKALRIARVLEVLWRVLPLPGEPPLTTYKAGILGISQTYDTSAAERDLGYAPEVSLEAGMDSVVRAWQASAAPVQAPEPDTDPTEASPIRLTILQAGAVRTREKFFYPGGTWRPIAVPALFGILDHPVRGPIVFDTGYSHRFHEGTRGFPFRLIRWATPAVIPEYEEAVRQVRAHGVEPEAVPWVLLSHFDPDHYGGLKDFPNARVICTAAAWESVRGKSGWAAFRTRLIPGHLPEDMAARLWILPEFDGPPIGPFSRSLDLFGDGTLHLVELPGHAAGQVGVFLSTPDGRSVFLAADGCWNQRMLAESAYGGGIHRIIAMDWTAQDETYARLRALRRDWPNLHIIPSHCPEAWREWNTENADTKG